ncbi:MAG TPA: hypothetical protein VLL97_10440 [Acidobacteriota bacterium]|nr:hypothetical protein [Acidobacteriota bacterium]
MELFYEIDGKTYVQRPLVLGQLRQLLGVLKGVTIPTALDAMGLVNALSGHLPRALAVVLTPAGISPRDKDIDALASEIEFAITPEQVFEVVDGFFGCNPLPSLLKRLGMVAGNITAQMTPATESMPSVFHSQPATLPGETPSSGDTP